MNIIKCKTCVFLQYVTSFCVPKIKNLGSCVFSLFPFFASGVAWQVHTVSFPIPPQSTATKHGSRIRCSIVVKPLMQISSGIQYRANQLTLAQKKHIYITMQHVRCKDIHLHFDSFIGPFSKSAISYLSSLECKTTLKRNICSQLMVFVAFCQLSLPYTVASTEWQHCAVHLGGNLYESDCILMKQHLASPSCQDDHAWFLPSKWSYWRYGSQHGGTIEYQQTFAVTCCHESYKFTQRVTLVLPDGIGPPKPPCNDEH